MDLGFVVLNFDIVEMKVDLNVDQYDVYICKFLMV